MSITNDSNIFDLLLDMQKQLILTQNTYQKYMMESHVAFLNSVNGLAEHIVNYSGKGSVTSAKIMPPENFTLPIQTESSLQTSTITKVESTDQIVMDFSEIQNLIIQIISEKTGYLPEMLDLDMDVEADLGIDSIKRVEILAAVKEKMPHLPELDLAKLVELKTIYDFLNYLKNQEPALA